VKAAELAAGFVFRGFSGESLGLLRAYFGCGLLAFHLSQFGDMVLILDPLGVSFRFTEPIWYFEVLGIHTHFPLLTPLAFALLMAATVAMILGVKTRTAILVVLLCVFYLKGVRDSFAGDVHHRYLMPVHMLLLLLASRCGDVRSRDARRRAPPPLAEWEASWPIKSMQLYVACFYFWGVIAKLRMSGFAWFAGGNKIQEILFERASRRGVEFGELVIDPLALEMARTPWLLETLGWFTFSMEAGFPLILLIRDWRWRLVFLLAVAGFHLANFLLLGVMFLMIPIVFLVFFDLVPVHAWLQRKLRRPGTRHAET
jgi:hypothetical protein